MSWLSSGLKKVGGVAEKVAPFAGLIPGVGTGIGAAIGGIGALAHGDGVGGALKYGAMGAAGGALNGSMLGGRGVLGIPGALAGGGLNGGMKKVGGLVAGNPASGGPSDIGTGGGLDLGSIGGLGGLALGGLKKIGIDGALAGGSAIMGAQASKKATDYRNQALKLVTDQYNQQAPLRTAGIAGMLNTQRPDLSSTYADPQNPFARRAV